MTSRLWAMQASAVPRVDTTSCESAFAATSARPDNLGNMIANSVWTVIEVDAAEPRPFDDGVFVVVPDVGTAANTTK